MTSQNTIEQTVREQLEVMGYDRALGALGFASRFHTGTRRDGSAEFSHQLEIASYILDLEDVPDLEDVLCIIFLHDVREDHGVADCVIRFLFGGVVADAVSRVTKTFRGNSLPIDIAFSLPGGCPLAAITKGADRIHNLRTMRGAFDAAKQASYRLETRTHIIPMLRAARLAFTDHTHILDRIVLELVILSTIALDQTKSLERIPHDA